MEGETIELRRMVDQLMQRVDAQERVITMLEQRIARADHPLKPVFLAKVKNDGTWQERANISAAFADYDDGRKNTGSSSASVPIPLECGGSILLEDQDGTDYRYVELAPPIPVKVISVTDHGGYNLRILTGGSTADGTSDLTMPGGLTVPASNNALGYNPEEGGNPTNWLKLNSFALGALVGKKSDGTPILQLSGVEYKTASPQALAVGTSETANVDTWTRSAATSGTDYGDIPVTIQFVARTVYNASGDQKIYNFVKTMTIDAGGRVVNVSPETRVIVDTPDGC